MEKKFKDIDEILEVPKEYHTLSEPKSYITSQIKSGMNEQGLSIRRLGEKIGLKHPQVVRVTRGNNYNIDTLLKILDGLNLEIVIKKKVK